MAENSNQWADIDNSDEDEPTNVQSPVATDETKESGPKEYGPKQTFEQQQETFPTKPELINAIKEMEDNFVQVKLCKANYNADVKDVLEALQSRNLHHGTVRRLKEGLFTIDFNAHDQAISFIKQTPKVLDRPYFVQLSFKTKDHVGWTVEGQKPFNTKGHRPQHFNNDRPPRKHYEKRTEKFHHHQDHEEHEGSGHVESAHPTTKDSTISRGESRYDKIQSPVEVTESKPVHTEEKQDDAVSSYQNKSKHSSEEAPPPGITHNYIQHQKKEYQKPEPKPVEEHTVNPEQLSKAADGYKPQGFSKGTAHQKSEDHQEAKHANPFGQARNIIPKEIKSEVKMVAPVNIAQDAIVPEYIPIPEPPVKQEATKPAAVAEPVQPQASPAPPVTVPSSTGHNPTKPSPVVHSGPATSSTTAPVSSSATTGGSTGSKSKPEDAQKETPVTSAPKPQISQAPKQFEPEVVKKKQDDYQAPTDEWIVSGGDKGGKNRKKK